MTIVAISPAEGPDVLVEDQPSGLYGAVHCAVTPFGAAGPGAAAAAVRPHAGSKMTSTQ
jgi:hypothetical protein